MIDQGERDAKLKGYATPEGVKVEIVADAAVTAHPVGMTFGDDGSLYVLEWTSSDKLTQVQETFTYRDGSKRTFAAMKKPVKDVVKRLRDTNGDGVYDEAKVILEDELPSGMLLHDGWLYLSGRGTVRRYRQSMKGDGPYDVKEVIAQGFGGVHHAQVSGLTLGNDGWLYITTATRTTTMSKAPTAAGRRCCGPAPSSAAGPTARRCTSTPSASAIRIGTWPSTSASRCSTSTTTATTAANGPAAGCCKSRRTATMAGGATPTGQADPFRAAVWGELPGKLTPLLKTGRGGPAGLLIYEENRFPEPYRGLVYYPDVIRQSIRAYAVRPAGTSFVVVQEFELLKSADPLFHPCQMIAGPDGAMYVCSTPIAAGADAPGSPRIFKLSWSGTAEQPAIALRGLDSWARLADKSIEQLQQMMASENQSDRLRGQRELVRRGGKEIRELLLKDLEDSDQDLLRRVSALGALNSLWNRDVKLAFLRIIEGAGSPDLRRLAAEGIALNANPGDIEVQASLLRALEDQNLAARRAIALAMGKVGHPDAADALVAALKFNRENEPVLVDGYLRALERLGKPGIDKLIELSQSGDDKDFDRAVDVFSALRTREAADGIPQLLQYPHLKVPQKIKLLEAYRHILTDPPVSLAAVVKYLPSVPNDQVAVQVAGLQTLALGDQPLGERLENQVINLLDDQEQRGRAIELIGLGRVKRAAPKLAGMLADTTPAEALAIVKALRVLEDKSVAGVVKEVARSAKQPVPVRGEALQTLATLDGAAAAEVAKEMAQALLAKELPPAAAQQIIEVLRRHAAQDPEAAKLLAQLIKK